MNRTEQNRVGNGSLLKERGSGVRRRRRRERIEEERERERESSIGENWQAFFLWFFLFLRRNSLVRKLEKYEEVKGEGEGGTEKERRHREREEA